MDESRVPSRIEEDRKPPHHIETLVVVHNNYVDSDDNNQDDRRELKQIRQTTAKYRSYSSLSRTYEDSIERSHSVISNRVIVEEKKETRIKKSKKSPRKEKTEKKVLYKTNSILQKYCIYF